MTPTIILDRHGHTEDNEKGIVRGWRNEPLTPKGEEEKRIAAQRYYAPIKPAFIHCGTLGRVMQSGIIAQEFCPGSQLVISDALNTWDVGDFTGEKESLVKKDILRYIMEKPDQRVPGGESFWGFSNRFLPYLKGLMDQAESQKLNMVALMSVSNLLTALDWLRSGMGSYSVRVDTMDEEGDQFLAIETFVKLEYMHYQWKVTVTA